MRLQFSLKTLLLSFLAISLCFLIVPILSAIREQREISRVRREMPGNGVSLKYEKHGDGILCTMLASETPIQDFSIELKDDQNGKYFDTGIISVEPCHTLKFIVQIKNSGNQKPNDAGLLLIEMPETLQGKKYHLSSGMAYLGWHYFLDGGTILDVFDEQQRPYTLWLMLKP